MRFNMLDTGNQIKKLRVKKKLTEKEFSLLLNFPLEKVYNWENNIEYPNLKQLLILSNFFEITVDELITGKKTKDNDTNFWDFMNLLIKRWWIIFPVGGFITWIINVIN